MKMGEYKCSFDNNQEFVRGTAVVISMTENRKGAIEEKALIQHLADFFHFEAVDFIDSTASALQKEIRTLAGNLEENKDCFVCFVNAHGGTDANGNGYIEDNAGTTLFTYEDIMAPFLESQPLRGKPKVFVINACRGDNTRTTSLAQATRSEEKEGKKRMHRTIDLLANRTDVLAVFSTDVGDKSWRKTDGGAIFISSFTTVVTKCNNDDDLISVIIKVNNELSLNKAVEQGKYQTLVMDCTLTKKLYWRTMIKETNEHGMDVPKQQSVPDQILGQTEHFNELKRALCSTEVTKPKWFGVVGMGGIGKSTLAKTLYNDRDIRKHYEGHVYWLEVKHKPDIERTQRALLLEMEIRNPYETAWNADQLRRKIAKGFEDVSPFLLVLDDVWSMQDIVKMLGKPLENVIPKNCACLITTRNKRELEVLKAKTIQLDLLSDVDSRYLFCLHAFGDEEIPNDLVPIVRKTIKACGSIPILLEIIGAERFGKRNIHNWEGILEKVEKASEIGKEEYDEGILEVLQLSYDALRSNDLKDMFLDFAYFLKHEKFDIRWFVKLWPPSVTENNILDMLRELEGKCLVKLSTYNLTQKQYQIRPDIAHDAKVIDFHDIQRCQMRDEMWQMLPIGKEFVVVMCEMHDFLKQLARKIIEKAYIASKPYEARTLIFRYGDSTKFPAQICVNLGMLESLNIIGCGILTLPPEIGNLGNLKTLNLSECWETKLPREIGQLGKRWSKRKKW